MSPELETLDQLQSGDLPLATIRGLYPTLDRFAQGVSGLLVAGDVKLIFAGAEVAQWQWAQLLTSTSPKDGPVLALTAQGSARIG